VSARRWLHDHLSDAPPELLEAMSSAVPDEGDAPEGLAAGAMSLFERVLRGSGGREDALSLLAADALLTHALEAQAELDPEGLPAFAARWGGGGRLGALVQPGG
jgi:hypothetical protein